VLFQGHFKTPEARYDPYEKADIYQKQRISINVERDSGVGRSAAPAAGDDVQSLDR